MRRYPIGHFDAYTREWLERIAADQIAFLHAHLGTGPSARRGGLAPAGPRPLPMDGLSD